MRFTPINTWHWRWLWGKILLIAFVVLLSCAPLEGAPGNEIGIDITPTVTSAVREVPLPITVTPAGETVSEVAVFFTDPYTQPSSRQQEGLDELLTQAIHQAQSSVMMAIYNLSLENVADALFFAYQRGVHVRLVMESNAMDGQ